MDNLIKLPLDIGPFNYEDNIKTIESKYLKVKNTFSQKDLNEYQQYELILKLLKII